MNPARIHLSAPDVRTQERAMINAAIDSNWIAPAGPDLASFEEELATATGRQHAVGLSSGTGALHLGLIAAGVTAGAEVLCSTLTFIGSASPIVHCQATPVFIDSDAETWNLSAELLAEELDERRRQNRPLPAAAVVVDLYGVAADYTRLIPILDEHNIALIEDAAEALGATHAGARCGSFGQSAILSFNGNKIITTSGGGAFVTDDPEAQQRVRHLATQAREPVPHYEHREIGWNYRMSNLLAAFGRGQLATLDARIERRRAIRDAYASVLADDEFVDVHHVPPGTTSNHWLTCITIDPAHHRSPEDVRLHLEGDNIESRPIWKPMHLQPVFANAPRRLNGVSERLFERGLCLPSGSGMSDDDLSRVCESLTRVLKP